VTLPTNARAPDAGQRAALAAWCAADPGPIHLGWVPVLRSSVPDNAAHRRENAAPRPGHDACRQPSTETKLREVKIFQTAGALNFRLRLTLNRASRAAETEKKKG